MRRQDSDLGDSRVMRSSNRNDLGSSRYMTSGHGGIQHADSTVRVHDGCRECILNVANVRKGSAEIGPCWLCCGCPLVRAIADPATHQLHPCKCQNASGPLVFISYLKLVRQSKSQYVCGMPLSNVRVRTMQRHQHRSTHMALDALGYHAHLLTPG